MKWNRDHHHITKARWKENIIIDFDTWADVVTLAIFFKTRKNDDIRFSIFLIFCRCNLEMNELSDENINLLKYIFFGWTMNYFEKCFAIFTIMAHILLSVRQVGTTTNCIFVKTNYYSCTNYITRKRVVVPPSFLSRVVLSQNRRVVLVVSVQVGGSHHYHTTILGTGKMLIASSISKLVLL